MLSEHEKVSEAKLIVQEAFDRFHNDVTPEDFDIFQDTSIQDVSASARRLEEILAPRQDVPNTGRLYYLFSALSRFQEATTRDYCDSNCLPLLWAPVRLTLELTENHGLALNRLIAAYKSIAIRVPHFVNVPATFRSSDEFQQIVALIYAEILSFHSRIYLLLKQPGWQTFFEFLWDKSKRRREHTVECLKVYQTLLSQESNSRDIEEARMAQEKKLEDLTAFEEEQEKVEFDNVQSWLCASKLDQDDILYDLESRCHPGSCDWICVNAKVKSWIRQGSDHGVIWLKGKPGSGKSVLCAKLTQHLQSRNDNCVAYFFRSEAPPETKSCHSLLRGLIRQLVQKQQNLCTFIQTRYVNAGYGSSMKRLREVFRAILLAFKNIRIIVDGIDECAENEQKFMLTELLTLTRLDASKRVCKILISSQDTVCISRSLRERSIIDLNNEHVAIQAAISAFVHAKIEQSPLFSNAGGINKDSLKNTEKALVDKADGMFLWVELVITLLERAYSPQAVQQAVDDLPSGLEKIYDKILARIEEQDGSSNGNEASRIFQWLACSCRQLRKYEIQDAVTLNLDNPVINEDTRVNEQVFELCKPLVESSTGEVVRFVHVTVKEFLLKRTSPSKLFTLSTALSDATFTCLAYLNFGTTLVDSNYDDGSRLIEVGKGLHGLCQYACRYWVEHLLTYMQSTENTSDGSSKTILKTANSLAQALSVIADHGRSVKDGKKLERLEQQAKLDQRSRLLRGNEPLYSIVLSMLEAQLNEKISPRPTGNDAEDVDHPVRMIQRKYELLVAQLLRSESVPGLSNQSLTAFKKTYRACVLVCRFADCPRELHAFASAEERDVHEMTHRQIFRCPHPECAISRIGLPNNKRLQRHLQLYHPEPATVHELSAIKPFGDYRVATDATLVEPTPSSRSKAEISASEQDSDEGSEEANDVKDYVYSHGKVDRFADMDYFALGSTQWT